jgi:hypothetical protein
MSELAILLAGCEENPGVLADYLEEHHGLTAVPALLRMSGPPPERKENHRAGALDDAGLSPDVFVWLAVAQQGAELGFYAHPETGPWTQVLFWRRSTTGDYTKAVEAARAELRKLPAP